MSAYISHVDNDLKRWGFNNYREMLHSAIYFRDFQFLQNREAVHLPLGNGTESILFQFTLFYDQNKDDINLESITAKLKRDVDINGYKENQTLAHKNVDVANGQQVTKAEIIDELTKSANLRLYILTRAKNIKQLRINKTQGKQSKI